MGFQSVYEDKSDRDDVYQNILEAAIIDPLIDLHSMAKLMDAHEGEVDLWIRTGYNDIIDSMQEEIDNDGANKAFLLSITTGGNTIMDEIQGAFI